MAGPRLVVFSYNFPHKRCQDVLIRLYMEGHDVAAIVAADAVPLNIPPSAVRTKVRRTGPLPPYVIAERIGARYHVMPHDSESLPKLIQDAGGELGIIAGARILKKPVIDAFKLGVINVHPGLIPESRGLDALLWSVHRDIPLGATAHLIDERVDAGRILVKRQIPIYRDDTVYDLTERLYDLQIELFGPAINKAVVGESILVDHGAAYNRKMPAGLEQETFAKIPEYIRRFASDGDGTSGAGDGLLSASKAVVRDRSEQVLPAR